MTQEIEDQLYKAYDSIKPYLISKDSREIEIKYPAICQPCINHYDSIMITGYSVAGRCDICKHYSKLAIVKKNWN